MNNDKDPVSDGPPAALPWISTEHDLQAAARPGRTRIVKVRMRNGVYRIATATYSYASVRDPGRTVQEHLYRVGLQWLAEYDTRDGRSEKVVDRSSASRPINALQFRVLEMTRADGGLVAARLGPKGQISADPKGLGVMSFLRGLLVEWVASEHPTATVVPGSLLHVDSKTAEECALRDNFFMKSGFTVKATSDAGGRFFAPSIQDLRSGWNAEKVVEIAPSVIAEGLCAQMEATQLRKQIASQEAEIVAMRKEKRASEIRSRIWLAITVVSVVFGIVFGIQPRVA